MSKSKIAKELASLLKKPKKNPTNRGGGKTSGALERIGAHLEAMRTPPTEGQAKIKEVTKTQRAYRQGQNKAGAAGATAGGATTYVVMKVGEDTISVPADKANDLNSLKPEDVEIVEPSDFEKAFSQAFKDGKEVFEFEGRKYTTELKRGENKEEDSREKFSKGKIVDMAATFLKKQVDNETGKATKAAKDEMVSQSQIDELIEKEFMDNPFNPFEDLDEEEYSLIVDAASPKKRSMLLGDEMGAESMGEMDDMMSQLEPEEVAQNLAFFGDVDEIINYAQSLDAGQTRKFIEAIPEEDYEMFGGFENIVKELGPRELKNKGGEMTALLVPVEMQTGDDDVKPDDEMEEDYVDFILHECLDEEEYETLDKKLSKDDDLSIMFDKIILFASEFTGAGEVEGPGDGTSDEIPARLSDGEFVFTKKAVDEIGADKLETMMKEAEEAYDERQGKAEGGMMKKPDAVDMYESGDEDIYNSMLSANRMPSLR